MTVPALEPVKNHYGNGSNDKFDFNFYIEDETQLAVYKTNTSNIETQLVNGIDYSINEIGNRNGSYITFPLQGSTHSVLKTGEVLSIQLNLLIEQETEYDNSSKLHLPAIEYSFDYLTRILQMLSRRIDRAVKVTEGGEMTADELLNSIYVAQENTKMNADSAKNTSQEAYVKLEMTNDTLLNIQELVQEVREESSLKTYLSTHNLFAIEELDKKLSEKELIGYGVQGETYSQSYYPDAYLELANDYENGIKNIFTSDEVETYSKHYIGDITGDFYIPQNSSLDIGQEIYSNIETTESIGSITNVEKVFANSYVGSINNFYIPLGQDLENGIEVYLDSSLINSIGSVIDAKSTSGIKYSSSFTGFFYTENKELKKGLKVYSDEALSIEIGAITKFENFYADRYSVDSFEDVYVPQNNIINVGSKIYSDILCTKEIGEVTEKGTITESVSYSYSAEFVRDDNKSKKQYFYTKRALDGKWQWAYSDSACTKKFIWNSTGTNSAFNGKAIKVAKSNKMLVWITSSQSGYTFTQICTNLKLITKETLTNTYYICIDNSSEQLQYAKLGTDSIEVISINTNKDEAFELEKIYEKSFIKISDLEYQSYVFDGNIESIKLSIDDGAFEQIKDLGINSVNGISFEYSLADDTHKVVDSKYKNVVASYIDEFETSPYYIIDRKNKEFTLPIKDRNKNIYFCLGNTRIKSASIDILNMIYDKFYNIEKTLFEILGE